MKSIYKRIAFILMLAFIAQIVLVGIFYRQVMVKQIIGEISEQENARQKILQDISYEFGKNTDLSVEASDKIKSIAARYHANIVIEDAEGKPLINFSTNLNNIDFIKEHTEIKKSSKIQYIIYGYFPPRISNIDKNLQNSEISQDRKISILDALLIFLVSLATMLIIFIILTDPLKKLSKAVVNINYGNTLVKIPYYNNDEFGKLCRNFEDMGKRLRKSEDNQQELIQAVSHDIKTPLTSIIGFSKRLKENKVSEDRKADYYETVYRKAIELQEILEELEEYANNNVEKQYSFSKLNCKQYVTNLCMEFKTEYEQKGCIFNYNIDINENIHINTDTKKMKRVFVNIINNSLKYAGDNCTVTVNCSIIDNALDVAISDNGEGVPEEFINKIFDRFYRVDSSRSREKGGTGLGLAICKEIVEKHHGKIYACNNNEGGLCISFTIPITQV